MIEEYLREGQLTLDVEFGNSHGFFSGSKSGLYSQSFYSSMRKVEIVGSISKARLRINEYIDISSSKIDRRLSFTPIVESVIYDLVSRFVLLSNDRPACISGHEIRHASRNIYYQYEAHEATVPLGQNSYLKFQDAGSTFHPDFENVFYIRDEGVESDGLKRWVVHHRMITKKESANLIVRSCNPYFEGPLPAQWLIPNFVKERLFRIRERQYPGFPFMSVGEIQVPSGVKTEINTHVEFFHE